MANALAVQAKLTEFIEDTKTKPVKADGRLLVGKLFVGSIGTTAVKSHEESILFKDTPFRRIEFFVK